MFLSDIHEQLHAGELSQLFEGEGDSMSPDAQPRINRLILAGLNDLNKHFTIREKEILVTTKIGKSVYELVPANAVSNGNPYAFIQDSVADPFLGDIMQIINITDPDGKSLYLNQDVGSLTPTGAIFATSPGHYKNVGINLQAYNTFKLAADHDYGDLLVKYKAKITPFDSTLNPETIYIDVPDHFMNALVLYVASRKYNPMGSETIGRGMFHEGNNYWSKYVEEINSLKQEVASIASTGENNNFKLGGWV